MFIFGFCEIYASCLLIAFKSYIMMVRIYTFVNFNLCIDLIRNVNRFIVTLYLYTFLNVDVYFEWRYDISIDMIFLYAYKCSDYT